MQRVKQDVRQNRLIPSERPLNLIKGSDFRKGEENLWKEIDPNGYIHPRQLPRSHRLAIVWAIYQILRITKDFLDNTLPDITKTMGFFIGMSVRTGLDIAIKSGMHAIASEKDPFLLRSVNLLFANLPPDIGNQAKGVVQFLRSEASKLQSTKKVKERLNILVKKFESLFYTLDLHSDKRREIPYQMPSEVYDLFKAVQEHHYLRMHQRGLQLKYRKLGGGG